MIVYLLRRGEDEYFSVIDLPNGEEDLSKGTPVFTKQWATGPVAEFKRRQNAKEYIKIAAREGDPEWKIIKYDKDAHCRTEVEP